MSAHFSPPQSSLFLLTITFLCYTQACQQNHSSDTYLSPVVPELLEDVGTEVIIPSLAVFQDELFGLQDSLENPSANDITLIQEQWKSTMKVWQRLEMMQIGPIGSSITAVGGMNYRDEIYSWPLTDGCSIHRHLIEESWNQESFFTENQVYAYGMDAIEHLLFSDISICPSSDPLIADGIWEAQDPETITQRKFEFARALCSQLQIHTTTLISMWSPEEGDFVGKLAQTNSSSPYASPQQALNAVYDSLFYLEIITKDQKLAQPLGMKNCSQDLCLEDLEGRMSQQSLSNIIENIHGFRLLFTGGEGIGFDDLLIDLGHAELAEQILSDIDSTLLLSEQLEGPLDELLLDRKELVLAFYYSLRNVTTALKVDLAMILAMTIPAQAAGDLD